MVQPCDYGTINAGMRWREGNLGVLCLLPGRNSNNSSCLWKERSSTLLSLLTSPPEESTPLGFSHENVDSFPPELPALHPGDSGTTVSAI